MNPPAARAWVNQAVFAWCLLIMAAFLEGIFRRLLLEPWMPRMLAECIGIFVVLATASTIVWGFTRKSWLPAAPRQLLLVGLMWVALTVAFEFIFFHYAMGMPWPTLFENYNVATGHLFPIGLCLLLFVPLAVGRCCSATNAVPRPPARQNP